MLPLFFLVKKISQVRIDGNLDKRKVVVWGNYNFFKCSSGSQKQIKRAMLKQILVHRRTTYKKDIRGQYQAGSIFYS